MSLMTMPDDDIAHAQRCVRSTAPQAVERVSARKMRAGAICAMRGRRAEAAEMRMPARAPALQCRVHEERAALQRQQTSAAVQPQKSQKKSRCIMLAIISMSLFCPPDAFPRFYIVFAACARHALRYYVIFFFFRYC